MTVTGAAKLIDFLKQGFGATETFRHDRPDGTVGHAEVKIGDSPVMLAEAGGEFKPKPANLFLYVTDIDAVYKRAIQAGGTSTAEPTTQFYGDRTYRALDIEGHVWNFNQEVAAFDDGLQRVSDQRIGFLERAHHGVAPRGRTKALRDVDE